MIGKSFPRVEGAAKVSGGLRYAADSSARLAVGQSAAQPAAARAHPEYRHEPRVEPPRRQGDRHRRADIKTTLVGATLRDMPVMARDRVRFIGEEIAAVAAVDTDTAEEGGATDRRRLRRSAGGFRSSRGDEARATHPAHPITRFIRTEDDGAGAEERPDARARQEGEVEKGFAESDYSSRKLTAPSSCTRATSSPTRTVEVDGEGRVAIWVANQAFFKLRRVLRNIWSSLRKTSRSTRATGAAHSARKIIFS